MAAGSRSARRRRRSWRAQQVEQQFTAPGGFGSEQHARRACRQVCHQCGRRLLRTGVDAHPGRGRAVEVLHVGGIGRGRKVRPFEVAKLHLPPCRALPVELGRSQIQVDRVEDRTAAVVAQLFVPQADALPQILDARAGLVDLHNHAVGRQVFEQIRGALEEQRQEEFDPARRDPLAHVAIDQLLGEIPGKSQPVTAAKFAYRVRVQRGFARRQQFDALQLRARTLAVGIEAPDGVHVAIEHVDAVRRDRTHRKDVDQRAAQREFAVRHHLRDRRVACEGQFGAQRIDVQGLADMHFEGEGLDVTARRQPLHQGVHGYHPHAAAGSRQLRQGREPRRGDVRMGREAVVGQRFQIRKVSDRVSRPGEKGDLIAQRLRVARIRCDDEERRGGGGGGFRDGERRRRSVETTPFDLGMRGRESWG